ncbi:MAG: thiamine pyrophosphate-dependent enzyme [Marmoricola sp.]
MTKAARSSLGNADLVIVVGTPLDFRLSYGAFGQKDGGQQHASYTWLTAPIQVSLMQICLAVPTATSPWCSMGLQPRLNGLCANLTGRPGCKILQATVAIGLAKDGELLAQQRPDPSGAHLRRVDPASGRRRDDHRRRRRLHPLGPGDSSTRGPAHGSISPYGCLGASMGAAIAADYTAPQVRLYCFTATAPLASLMDVDTLVRHNLPVVMICGNNCRMGLGSWPMQMLYSHDVAAV